MSKMEMICRSVSQKNEGQDILGQLNRRNEVDLVIGKKLRLGRSVDQNNGGQDFLGLENWRWPEIWRTRFSGFEKMNENLFGLNLKYQKAEGKI